MPDSLSLYVIEDGLAELSLARQELLEERAVGPARANARPPAEIEAELAEVEKTLREYDVLEARKADNCHRFVTMAGHLVAALKSEELAIANRRRRVESAVAFIKARIMEAMLLADKKRVDGTGGRYLLRKGNGGVEPVQVDNWDDDRNMWTGPEVVGEEFLDVTITMPGTEWGRLLKAMDKSLLLHGEPMPIVVPSKFVREPSKPRLRAALSEPCDHCRGAGSVIVSAPAEMSIEALQNGAASEAKVCPTCHGSKRKVLPGARLRPRGEHVEVK